MLEMKNVSVAYRSGGKSFPVLRELSLRFPRGFNVILGPNGAGKTTLIKAIFGLLPYTGQITLDGRDVAPLSMEEKTKLFSYLPQMDITVSTLSVLEMALLGRVPELSRRVKDEDLAIVIRVLEELGLGPLTNRPFSQLSGGQQKMVLIAQTLVRSPSMILLDEPVNSLDMQKQLELCHRLREITLRDRVDVVAILHDVNLAARFADCITVLDHHGGLYGQGSPREMITEEMVRAVYGVEGRICPDEDGVPFLIARRPVNESKE